MKPLAIDLYCGLGGWTEGLLAEGYDVIGFDVEQHAYGEHHYPGQLVIQDVTTLAGKQFRDVALIVASPPCQEYSYMAMPWTRAKAKAAAIRADETGQKLADLNRLFDACFRIQREACEAAERRIPLIVENVRGAQPWVGRGRWNFGSFYLWGDVPALMPPTLRGEIMKAGNVGWRERGPGRQLQDHAIKVKSLNFSDFHKSGYKAQGFNVVAAQRFREGQKVPSQSGGRTEPGKGARFTSRDCGIEVAEGRKGAGAGAEWFDQNLCALSSKSNSRKAASALIAKIPLPLSRHIAATFKPRGD